MYRRALQQGRLIWLVISFFHQIEGYSYRVVGAHHGTWLRQREPMVARDQSSSPPPCVRLWSMKESGNFGDINQPCQDRLAQKDSESRRRRRHSTDTIMEALRNKARSHLHGDGKVTKPSLQLTTSTLQSAIIELLRKRRRPTKIMDSSQFHAPTSLFGRTIAIGLINEPTTNTENPLLTSAATFLAHAALHDDAVTVRLASPLDDADIASLRLSVFSEFSPDVKNQFRTRSCQAIYNRRQRGALCVVATVSSNDPHQTYQHIVGSAECSFDEFVGTRLGRQRPSQSILYVTEVAVNPLLRRKGIGAKLLLAIDEIGKARGAESLYLHVDVTNTAAISLYNKAGYEIMNDEPIYLEFTASLNLHPGATKGRVHHLLCKHMPGTVPTWLPEDSAITPTRPSLVVQTMGFEIPA
jgi:ribosomal protein S18 acetylase RimI-like enzyme